MKVTSPPNSFAPLVDRAVGRDVVVLARLHVDRDVDLRKVEALAAQVELALGQHVPAIEVAQVGKVQRLGHPRLVGVPEQQVERPGLLAHQVVVHEERPDQVVGPQ
jgi:hypothetical protein